MSFLLALGALGVSSLEAQSASRSSPSSRGVIEVLDESGSGKDLHLIRDTAEHALEAFEAAFGPLEETLRIVYGGRGCLRVGYDYQKKVVQFCANRRVIDSGTESVDVIRHELFHAMLCSKRPDTCTVEGLKDLETVALHEGLADFFAYSLAPDSVFGEGFYSDQPWIRTYRTSLCYSLVSSAHEKGNAIASRLVEEGRTLSEILPLIRGDFVLASLPTLSSLPCFSKDRAPSVETEVVGHTPSRLNRYYVSEGKSLELRFVPDSAALALYPDLEARWTLESEKVRGEALISRRASLDFVFSSVSDSVEKWTAGFYSRGERVGQRTFYFTRKRD